MTLRLRWHDDVPADLASVKGSFGQAAFEEARTLIADLPGEPLLGDWLERHEATGDLSDCRKVKFGPDELAEDGTDLGPALRLVYRLVPSNHEPRMVEVLAVAPRRDLVAYYLASQRLR